MNRYTTRIKQGKKAYLQQLTTIGWFELSQNEQAAIEEHLNKLEKAEHFMYVLSHINFDAEGFEDAEDYKRLMSELLSFTACKHLKVEVTQDDLLVKVNIEGQGKYAFEIDLEAAFGWFDDDLIDFLNTQVFPGEALQERLFAIPPCDQSIDLTFIPATLYAQALKVGVLTDDLEYFM
ncbi:hypothetical protein BKI52_16350 [marine bacterium AO1-C]|nr:hypothetical protein BKI52_16350 [marine bacterium AO1-C]